MRQGVVFILHQYDFLNFRLLIIAGFRDLLLQFKNIKSPAY